MYKIFEHNNNNNDNDNDNNNDTISYFVQTVKKVPILLYQHHVNHNFDKTFDGRFTSIQMHGRLFFTPARLDV